MAKSPQHVSRNNQQNQYEKPPTQSPDSNQNGHEIGYGKTPPHTRFKPGQSGNPKGRPKGAQNFKTDLKATLEARVKLKGDGKERKISTQAAMLMRLREKALSGNGRALDRLISLAQTYNNEETNMSADLSADDEKLLELYQARVLSGAAANIPSIEQTEIFTATDTAVERPSTETASLEPKPANDDDNAGNGT